MGSNAYVYAEVVPYNGPLVETGAGFGVTETLGGPSSEISPRRVGAVGCSVGAVGPV